MSRVRNSANNMFADTTKTVLVLCMNFIIRTVFIKELGEEYLGINGLFTNILSILSLAELGLGASINYALYKPLAENDIEKIKSLMLFYKRTYLKVAIFVFTIGLVLLPFLKYMILDVPNLLNINLIYIMFLMNSAASYLLIYKQTLVKADQKQYLLSYYELAMSILFAVLQIIVLIITGNYLLYLGIQIIKTLISNIILSFKINKMYRYLNDDAKELQSSDREEITKNLKAMLCHKIGTVLVMNTDSLLLAKYVSIASVGLYSNYTMVTSVVSILINMITQSVSASVGNFNVGATNEEKIRKFKVINFVVFVMSSLFCIGCILVINDFITLWIGQEYLLPNSLVVILIINLYLTLQRKSVLIFKDAQGLFVKDKYKAIIESIVNLIVSIMLATKYGMAGVLLGTMISTITTCWWIEPYVLYKYGFKTSIKKYFSTYFSYAVVMIITLMITWSLTQFIVVVSWLSFILKCMIITTIIFSMYFIVFHKKNEFIYLSNIVKTFFKKSKGDCDGKSN